LFSLYFLYSWFSGKQVGSHSGKLHLLIFKDDFKYHFVKWNIIKQPFPRGCLGSRDLIIFSEAVLGKWLWMFVSEKERLWRTMIKAKQQAEDLN